jgi:hypothetical protein
MFVVGVLVQFRSLQFAQIGSVVNNEGLGLTILGAWSEGTPERVGELHCKVQVGSKEISAFAILWQLTSRSGKESKTCVLEDRSLLRSGQKYQAGEIIEISSGDGDVTIATGDPIVKIDVTVDYVLFSDRSSIGKDQMGSNDKIRNRQLAAASVRRQLSNLLKEKGLSALLQELSDTP